MFKKIKHIHMVGIGGSGMSGIAEVLINLGYEISGSDANPTEITQRLEELGARISEKHSPSNIKEADVIVTSSAILPDNPEVVSAKRKKIPVIPRAEMLQELMRLKYAVTIAGTHGKTSTTSMAALVLASGGLDPTVVIGGRLNNIGSSAKLGKGQYIVAEVDESDGSFLKFSPSIAVVTNIDSDHLDYWGNIKNLKSAFCEFVNKVPFYGCAILYGDDKNVKAIFPSVKRKCYTYGIVEECDFMAKEIKFNGLKTKFQLYFHKKRIGEINLKVSGMHNVLNAVAASAVGIELGIDFSKIQEALFSFEGVLRRLQMKGIKNDILFVDDYGHHPTAIKITLETVKISWPKRKIFVVFQPHRFTRTKILHSQFGGAFAQAEFIWITDIYPAGEKHIDGVDSNLLLDGWPKDRLKDVKTVQDKEKLIEEVLKKLRPGDLLFTLGAGDVWKIGEEIASRIKETQITANKNPNLRR